MIQGRLCRVDNKSCVIPKASRTSNLFDRLRGLLGRPALLASEGLLIKPCSSVHTIGMKYKIDLAFLDRQWIIVKTVTALKPWRMAACPSAHMVLELAEGSLHKLQLETGTQLVWQNA